MIPIRVTCKGAELVRLDDLVPLQGNLKELSADNYEKLKQSILQYGISFPLFYYRDLDGTKFVIDGHQRNRVLNKMADEGFVIPPLPACSIDAKDKKEACEKILLISSQYGKMTQESLYEFIHLNEIDWPSLQPIIELPELNLDKFNQGYGQETSGDGTDSKEITCPQCGHSFQRE
jgi:hypothetical protein